MSHLALFTFIETFSLLPHGTKMQAQMKYESFEHMSTTMKKESSHFEKAKEQNGVACNRAIYKALSHRQSKHLDRHKS